MRACRSASGTSLAALGRSLNAFVFGLLMTGIWGDKRSHQSLSAPWLHSFLLSLISTPAGRGLFRGGEMTEPPQTVFTTRLLGLCSCASSSSGGLHLKHVFGLRAERSCCPLLVRRSMLGPRAWSGTLWMSPAEVATSHNEGRPGLFVPELRRNETNHCRLYAAAGRFNGLLRFTGEL